MKLGDLQVIQNLTFFVIGDLFNRFRIYHNLIKYNQIRNIFSNFHSLIQNIKAWLLTKRNIFQAKLNN